MTSSLDADQDAGPQGLTIAAAALLARAVGRHLSTNAPLTEADIPMDPKVLRSRLGAGGHPVSADQAWVELLERGLIRGTRQQWAPVVEGVSSDGS